MTTTLYFHDATTADTGTLPSAKLNTDTIVITATGAATNRVMNTSLGTAQVAPTLASNGSTSAQVNWWRRFVSSPLAAQTVGSATVYWKFQFAGITSNASYSPWHFNVSYLGIWRPSTGAAVGDFWNFAETPSAFANAGTAETLMGSVGGNAVTVYGTIACLDGDILVVEFTGGCTQGMGSSYTWTLDYDGTTADSATSCASYMICPTTLSFASASVPNPTPPIRKVNQTVNRAASYCRKNRLWVPNRRIFVPQLAGAA